MGRLSPQDLEQIEENVGTTTAFRRRLSGDLPEFQEAMIDSPPPIAFRPIHESLIASLANFTISAAIALALLAEFFLVNAREPQFPTFAPAAAVDRPAMVVARG
jgi:hypothetical protein